jgi:DNA end-binding protein Ku
MAARAIWKGVIHIERARVPVKLYSAVQEAGVHFRLLHEADLEPVKQRMVDPLTGEPVPADEIRRGYEVAEGTFVLLDDEELAKAEPEPSREIEVTRFLPLDHIEHSWYDRPYLIGPDGEAGSYFALVEALRKAKKEAIARWVMRKKEYVGALRPTGRHLMLITLRKQGEVIPASTLPRPPGRNPTRAEAQMAEQLVSALDAPFDPAEYQDEYRERVLELVKAKAKGRKVKMPRPKRRRAPESLERALEQSVKAAQKGKPRAA